jgi:hypothetical protein
MGHHLEPELDVGVARGRKHVPEEFARRRRRLFEVINKRPPRGAAV